MDQLLPKEHWSELLLLLLLLLLLRSERILIRAAPKRILIRTATWQMCQLLPKGHWPELILLLIRSERILIRTASKRILLRTATLQNAPTDPKRILIKTTSTTATTTRKNTNPNCLQKSARPNWYFAKWANCLQKSTHPKCYVAKCANCLKRILTRTSTTTTTTATGIKKPNSPMHTRPEVLDIHRYHSPTRCLSREATVAQTRSADDTLPHNQRVDGQQPANRRMNQVTWPDLHVSPLGLLIWPLFPSNGFTELTPLLCQRVHWPDHPLVPVGLPSWPCLSASGFTELTLFLRR